MAELPREVPPARRTRTEVPFSLRLRVRQAIADAVTKARLHFGARYAWPMPTVAFDLSGTSAGAAQPARNHLRFNPVLLVENDTEFLAQTVPHEVAHLVTAAVYGPRAKPHGREWRTVMHLLGAEPRRTHAYDVGNVQRRTHRTATRFCDCGPVEVTLRRLRQLRPGMMLACRQCGQPLRAQAAVATGSAGQKPSAPRSAGGHRSAGTSAGATRHLPHPTLVERALRLATDAGVVLPVALLGNAEALAALLEQPTLLRALPTERQLRYALVLAQRHGLTVPPDALRSRARMSEWIGRLTTQAPGAR